MALALTTLLHALLSCHVYQSIMTESVWQPAVFLCCASDQTLSCRRRVSQACWDSLSWPAGLDHNM
jgi:hypothetical protein